jgi:hypothetical protein
MKTTAIKKITGLLIAASLTTGIYAQVRMTLSRLSIPELV